MITLPALWAFELSLLPVTGKHPPADEVTLRLLSAAVTGKDREAREVFHSMWDAMMTTGLGCFRFPRFSAIMRGMWRLNSRRAGSSGVSFTLCSTRSSVERRTSMRLGVLIMRLLDAQTRRGFVFMSALNRPVPGKRGVFSNYVLPDRNPAISD